MAGKQVKTSFGKYLSVDPELPFVYAKPLSVDAEKFVSFHPLILLKKITRLMKKNPSIILAIVGLTTCLHAQVEPDAGKWKTWFIPSVETYRLPKPGPWKEEVSQIASRQKTMDSVALQQVMYWNAGTPGYRWQRMMQNIWMNDTSYNGALANMLLSVATYDATVAAWDTKYAFNRPRPFAADNQIKALIPKPESPSYPCEHSVAAGVAVGIFSHFYPLLADSVQRMAQRAMDARIMAGVAFPSDTRAGFELGKKIAEKEIEHTKNFLPGKAWDGKRPQGEAYWKGEQPMFPTARHYKTVVLDSSSQFRPGPPPDFAKDMEELKNYKPNFYSMSNAFYWASQPVWEDMLQRKIFEYNLHINPPRAARINAIAAIGMYDGFVACWDAKYTYWGIRPEQYDTTFHPVLFQSPPFPGYPSGHAMIGSIMAELYAYFFPSEKSFFRRKAKEAAESRFHGGIHFRTDNEVALDMGKKVAAAILNKVRSDGADFNLFSK